MIVPSKRLERLPIDKVSAGHSSRIRDVVAVEEPLEIRVRFRVAGAGRAESRNVVVTMRTPGDDFELAAGFLFTEGLIAGRRDILKITYCTSGESEQLYNRVEVRLTGDASFDPSLLDRHFAVTSSCGICGKTSIEAVEIAGCRSVAGDATTFSDALVRSLPELLLVGQSGFAETGGLHGAALFDAEGQRLGAAEDVGRHNAVDKVIGGRLLADALPLHGSILAVSGRASFEIVQKAVMAGIPVVVAVGAPSSLAVGLARRFGATLVGFTRAEGYNVYEGADRIRLPASARSQP